MPDRRPSRWLAVLLSTALALLAPRGARAVDPHLKWRTLETEHFLIHFPSGGYEVALRTGRYLEAAYAQLVPRLRHAPWTKTQVLLTDDVDTANGSATSIPFPSVHAYMNPPESDSILNNYDDYMWLLLVHEYVHVIHLDTSGGIPELASWVFGHLFGQNFLQPHWVIEGLATYYESSLTGEGRNNSALADMYLRAQVFESGRLWPVSETSGTPVDWPGGDFWYLYGGRIWASIVASRGVAAPSAVSHDYARRLFPFALNDSSQDAMHLRMADAYRIWADHEEARLQRQIDAVRKAGELRGRPVTRLGRTVTSPRWTPSGEALLAYVANGRAYPAIRRVDLPRAQPADLGETRVLLRVAGGGRFDLSRDGRIVVYGALDYFQHEQLYDDLYAADTRGGAPVRLTYGMRARDPALSADGRRLAFVAARRGEMGLYVMSVDLRPSRDGGTPTARLGEPRRVFHLEGAQLDRPALSADGRLLAVAVHRRGRGRDVALLDLSKVDVPPPDRVLEGDRAVTLSEEAGFQWPDSNGTSLAERQVVVGWVTDDGAQASDPTFAPSGRRLYLSSDRSGIYDLYAREIEDGRPAGPLLRVTRTPTGAFEPAVSPDGSRLAYVDYSSEGYDLAVLDLDPKTFQAAGPAAPRPADPVPVPQSAEVWPVRPYDPLPTLRPWYWLPIVTFNGSDVTFGVTTSGSDVVGLHAWNLTAWWNTADDQPGYLAAYSYGASYLGLGASSSRSLSGGVVQVDGENYGYREIRWQATASASYTIPHLDHSQAVALDLTVDHRTPLTYLLHVSPTVPPAPAVPSGTATRLGVRWSGSTAHRFSESISPQEGGTARVSVNGATPVLGGDYRWLTVLGGVTGYQSTPFVPLSVLALNLEAGIGFGDFGGRQLFTLGGLDVEDPILALYDGATLPAATLRGYPPYAFGGNAYGLANLEWRFPILTPQRGVTTLPFFLRRVSGAAFVDAGAVSEVPIRLSADDLKVGVGGELRFELELGYSLGVTLRVGFAQGLSEGGVSQPYLGFGGAF